MKSQEGVAPRGNAMIFASTGASVGCSEVDLEMKCTRSGERSVLWISKEVRHPEIFNIVTALDGRSVRFYSDPDRLQAHLLEISPQDKKLIIEFCDGLRKFIKCLKEYPFLRPVGLMGRWERCVCLQVLSLILI